VIVGLTGYRGSGKDAVANLLCQRHGFVRRAFADRLKEAAGLIYGLSHEQLHGDYRAKETVDPYLGLTPRFILQQLGTEVARCIHPDTWIIGLENWLYEDVQVQATARRPLRYVVPDVRFPNEAVALRAAERPWGHGRIVAVVGRRAPPAEDVDQHASETNVEELIAASDFAVNNSGDFSALRARVDALVECLGLA